ncbi:MAG: glycosyltransferase family 2 protein, partial [Chloroflexaceae bacterium]
IRLWQRCGDRVLLFVPGARVRHRVTEGRASWAYFRSRCYAEGFSKAQMARLVGSRDGLAAERDYVARTLPVGVARGLAEALTRRDAGGVRRAAAILAGLAITGFGYLSGALVGRLDARRRHGLTQYLLPRGAR